jgi:hypothetical protein
MPLRTRNACLAALALIAAGVSRIPIAQAGTEGGFCLTNKERSVKHTQCNDPDFCVFNHCIYVKTQSELLDSTIMHLDANSVVCKRDGVFVKIDRRPYQRRFGNDCIDKHSPKSPKQPEILPGTPPVTRPTNPATNNSPVNPVAAIE